MSKKLYYILVVLLFFIFACSEKSTEPESTFETGTVTDIDGNVYQTVKIGNQWWMAENLKVTRYSNGDSIDKVIDNIWKDYRIGACCSYDNDESNVTNYGLLYNWYATVDSRGIAPTGWHVPNDIEWQIVIDFLGGREIAGGKMKEVSAEYWQSPNTGASNESGFSALPGGRRDSYSGGYDQIGFTGFYWSTTVKNEDVAWMRIFFHNSTDIWRGAYGKQWGFSVRCIKD
jgi:uncharacterized protein (TIGR02145 family)